MKVSCRIAMALLIAALNGFFTGPLKWTIRIDEFRAAYWGAVSAEVQKRGRSCAPTNFKPYQDALLIDFRFTCDP